jgi:hypothetical protein
MVRLSPIWEWFGFGMLRFRGAGGLQELLVVRLMLMVCREGGPTIFAQVKHGKNVNHIVNLILSAWKGSGATQATKKEYQPVVAE